MAGSERISQAQVEAALRAVKRACYAGLDSLALRREVARRSRQVLSCEAYALATTDPETGLMTHSIREGLSDKARATFLSIYLYEEAERMTDLARSVADIGDDSLPDTPSAIVSLVGSVLATQSRREGEVDALPLDAHSRLRGRSGQWYELHASLAQPDANGHDAVTVVVAPVAPSHLAPLLARLYGLSPREWEVVSLVARGYSTGAVAARLCISRYTVQDHVDRACEKIGLRGRRMLLARLFHDTGALAAEAQSG